jgi:ElaB/YqjD/DUF883 family membrane-anchored ribosome-binding protein
MKPENIKATASDIADDIHAGVDEAESGFEDTVDSVSDRIGELEARLREETDRLVESMKEISGAATRYAQARPLAATGIAFVAGLIAARLLRR